MPFSQSAELSWRELASLSFTGLWVLFVANFLTRNVYNVFFHPLSKFPGPKWKAANYIPYYFQLATGNGLVEVQRLHDEYGPVVRVSPNELSFNTSQSFKDIYGRTVKAQLPKDREFYSDEETGKTSPWYSNDKDHQRIRKLLSHAFSDQALREQEPILNRYFDLLVTRLEEQLVGPAKGRVDLVKWLNCITFDITGDLSFGRDFDALSTGEYSFFMSNIFQGVKIFCLQRIGVAYPFIGIPIFYLMSLFPSIEGARQKHKRFSVERTNQRLDLGEKTDRKDFMSYILRHNDSAGMTKEEINDAMPFVLVAGAETTATVLSGSIFHLLKNREVLRKATDEVRSAFACRDDINVLALGHLPYLHAVLEETLRIYPPVPGSLPRKVLANSIIVDGHLVPNGTTVGAHHWATYHSAQNFRNAEKFVPERWLGDPEYVDDNHSALQPFSLGPRGCLGKSLAYAEMHSILARILWNFDMELCEESADWINQKVWILWAKPALHVNLKTRVS